MIIVVGLTIIIVQYRICHFTIQLINVFIRSIGHFHNTEIIHKISTFQNGTSSNYEVKKCWVSTKVTGDYYYHPNTRNFSTAKTRYRYSTGVSLSVVY